MQPRISFGVIDAKDNNSLGGTWKLVSRNGSAPAEHLVIIRDDLVQIDRKDTMCDRVYLVLDSSFNPKKIDLYASDENGKRGDKLYEGVFEVDGNRLRLCFAKNQGAPWNRPTELKAIEDTQDVRLCNAFV
jgi:uncharacterized protein (TIGR03067 family)